MTVKGRKVTSGLLPFYLNPLYVLAMRILLVEDDAEAASYMVKAFREAGHIADHVGDGLEGLARAQDETYDVLIIDRRLPKLDGLTLIGTISRVRSRSQKSGYG